MFSLNVWVQKGPKSLTCLASTSEFKAITETCSPRRVVNQKNLASDKHSTNDQLITLGTPLRFKYPLTSCFSESVFLMYKEIRFIVCNEPLNQSKKNFCYLVYRIVKETCFYFAFVIVEVPLYLQQLLPR